MEVFIMGLGLGVVIILCCLDYTKKDNTPKAVKTA